MFAPVDCAPDAAPPLPAESVATSSGGGADVEVTATLGDDGSAADADADAVAVALPRSASGDEREMAAIAAEDSKQFPLWAWAMLLPMTLYTIVYALMKMLYFDVCMGAGYWLWYVAPAASCCCLDRPPSVDATSPALSSRPI